MARGRSIGSASAVAVALALTACGGGADIPENGPFGRTATTPVTSPAPTSEATAVPSASAAPAAPAAVDAALREAYRAASGEDGPIRWADEVASYVGGELVARLSADEAAAGGAWGGCPEGVAEYAGRACPVDPSLTLAALLDEGGSTEVVDGVPATIGCDRVTPPEVPASVASATVVPANADGAAADCFSAFGWTLFVDGRGRVVASSLVLSGP